MLADVNYCDNFAIYTNIDSLWFTRETNLMYYVNYTSIKKNERFSQHQVILHIAPAADQALIFQVNQYAFFQHCIAFLYTVQHSGDLIAMCVIPLFNSTGSGAKLYRLKFQLHLLLVGGPNNQRALYCCSRICKGIKIKVPTLQSCEA